jgi:hypothetical protein
MDKLKENKTEDCGVYVKPQLEVYGDLRALTRNVGSPTRPDSSVSRTAGTRTT